MYEDKRQSTRELDTELARKMNKRNLFFPSHGRRQRNACDNSLNLFGCPDSLIYLPSLPSRAMSVLFALTVDF